MTTVSVVLPALNEEDTVAGVVATVLPHIASGLVKEVVVIDSDSTDRTATVAASAGATVVNWRDGRFTLPEPQPGKGEALWRGVAATTGDIVVFLDADLREPGVDWVPTLVDPLIRTYSDADPVRLVKGHYRRDLPGDNGGGRVTELTAKPLLRAFRPELAQLKQPLSGEYAARRDTLESIPFASGYGVEIAMLLDVFDRFGPSSITQVNLGARRHRNRPLSELSVMADQVMGAALSRLGPLESAPERAPLETFKEHGWA